MQCVTFDNGEPSGIAFRHSLQRGDAAGVALDRDDAACPQCEQRPCQASGTGSDFDDSDALERACGARDPRREIEIEEEILPKRLSRPEVVLADDVAQRRQIVERAHRRIARAPVAAI